MNAPARPLHVALVDDNDLSVAGLTALLAPYAARVQLLDTRTALTAPGELDIVLHEPLGRSSYSARLLGDLLSGGARSAVFTWAPPQELTDDTEPVLAKSMTASQVVRALEDIAQGRVVQPPRSTPASVATTGPTASGRTTDADTPTGVALVRPQHDLTVRELEVLTRVTRGLTNTEIGDELGLSINSIKTYIRSAYRKIGVSRRTQAVTWGLSNGLLEDSLAVA